MAIGWMAVLQMVPWSDVISNAPKVAEGAKKLWNTVGRKPADGQATVGDASAAAEGKLSPMAVLEHRLQAMEATTAALHEQMLASADLIRTLAEQNTQLIKRIEVNRVRLFALAVVTGVMAVMVITGIVLLMTRTGLLA